MKRWLITPIPGGFSLQERNPGIDYSGERQMSITTISYPKGVPKKLIIGALRGRKVVRLEMQRELVEVPSEGMYRKHVASGKSTMKIELWDKN